MFKLFFKCFAILSFPTLHKLGAALGWVIYFCSLKSAKIMKDNIKNSKLARNDKEINEILHENIAEAGKSILEAFAIWQKKEPELLASVKHVHDWSVVENALAAGKGIIFLTPHLGCFEITSIYYGHQYPITVLYRAPKMKWLMPLMQVGRTRTGVTLAEANAGGVRKLMQALKRGEAIGILPDQIPAAGEGEWADFFSNPAYTMTLASKLAEKTGATVIMAYGERLAYGAGYEIHLQKVESIATPALLNKAIEQQVAQKPTQYLWRYNRHKQRRHALGKETPMMH